MYYVSFGVQFELHTSKNINLRSIRKKKNLYLGFNFTNIKLKIYLILE